MEGGIKEFIETQKLEDGICTVTAAQFDTEYDVLFNRKPIADVEDITINPRGGTALIDSMVRLINEVGNDLAGMEEDERPEKVLFITITDGEENASKEFTNEELAAKIKEQEELYKWNFTYIGANQDAFGEAQKFGGRYTNSLNYVADSKGISKMFGKLSKATSRTRVQDISCYSGQSFEYTEDELKDDNE
jgi:hypothetical protein